MKPPTTSFYVWRRFFNEGAKHKSSQWMRPNGFTTKVTVHNSIEKCNVALVLKNKGILTWYMCGPTVYDSAHIGHACTYVRFDVIRRILSNFFDINVISVMGITDIDDKIIRRSLDTNQEWKQLTKRYEQEFLTELKLLNVLPPYMYCRVTEYIPQIIQFVESIVSMDAAYVGKDGSVYFDTTKCDSYGKLQKPLPSEPHVIKRSSTDFALWKASKTGEPYWESPWGPGRPGWHIECSTIASAVFGKTIDIHSGGVDLLFPHHENEEAQSCCYHQVDQWVNYWLHSGHLYLSGDVKMSKSLRNTIRIKEILEEYSSDQFRMLCLLTHYRTGIEFSNEKMQNAVRILNKIEHFLSDCRNYVSGKLNIGNIDETLVLNALEVTKDKVVAALAEDFDTTKTVLAIQDLIAVVNKMLIQAENMKSASISRNTLCIAAVSEYIRQTLSALGVWETESVLQNDNHWTDVIESFVNFRGAVRNRALEQGVVDKFLLQACDQARDNLSAYGVKVKDHKNTSTWTLTKD